MLSISLFITLSTIPMQALPSFEEKIPGTVVSFRMIQVPDGRSAVGGKEVPVKGLAVAEAEVTWDLYDIYAFQLDLPPEDRDKTEDARSRPSKPYGAPDRGFGHAGFPALGIHHQAAMRFCEWLSKKTGKKYRLPTEAEWEYFARAGTADNPANIEEISWHYDNTEQTQAVKKKKPNAWGIYDTFGNVMEWVLTADGEPVCVGGSYLEKPKDMSFGWRKPFDPNWQADDAHSPKSKWWLSNGPQVGLRVVCELQ
jgi:formylglycine-generating enzyme required for sulfatase activity